MTTLMPSFLIGSSSFLQDKRSTIKAWMGSEFGQIRPWTFWLVALERHKKSPLTYNWRNVVTTLVLSNLNRSYSFLQIRRKTKSSDEFEFHQDPIIYSGVSFP